jgi:hypothetical protein
LKQSKRKGTVNIETGNNKIGNNDRMEKTNEANICFFEKKNSNRIRKSLEEIPFFYMKETH